MKTHYAEIERDDDDLQTETWNETLCGLNTAVRVSDNIKRVNCKKCKSKHLKQQ